MRASESGGFAGACGLSAHEQHESSGKNTVAHERVAKKHPSGCNSILRKTDGERLEEYSDANIAFHQAIIRMSGCSLIAEMTENLFIHMRAIRKITIHQDNRAARSIIDHMRIIEALERRDAERAERLAREHTLGLAAHVEQHGDFLDTAREDV